MLGYKYRLKFRYIKPSFDGSTNGMLLGVKADWSKENLSFVVAQSYCHSDCLRRLGLCVTGGSRETLKKKIRENEIDVSHFDPERIIREAAQRLAARRKIPLEEILVEHSTFHRGHLKERLYAEGLKERICELCSQGEIWHGKRLALILDHINGVRDDHRFENLRIVCPNCDATLDTFSGRKRKLPKGKPGGQRGVPRPKIRKVTRPTYKCLMKEIEITNYSAVGRKYGVSDNAVRKWVRFYEASLTL